MFFSMESRLVHSHPVGSVNCQAYGCVRLHLILASSHPLFHHRCCYLEQRKLLPWHLRKLKICEQNIPFFLDTWWVLTLHPYIFIYWPSIYIHWRVIWQGSEDTLVNKLDLGMFTNVSTYQIYIHLADNNLINK